MRTASVNIKEFVSISVIFGSKRFYTRQGRLRDLGKPVVMNMESIFRLGESKLSTVSKMDEFKTFPCVSHFTIPMSRSNDIRIQFWVF